MCTCTLLVLERRVSRDLVEPDPQTVGVVIHPVDHVGPLRPCGAMRGIGFRVDDGGSFEAESESINCLGFRV
jgi:hypothetical protein